ncbi:MAG: hypothetical protein KGL42_16610 [Betaproteobacteria bacterium]|nr:hypothetical protein [Betaproteobacteria bacterium]
MKALSPIDCCPCGSGKSLADCCEAYLVGAIPAPTAEALMRSRYLAYALGREPYLLATWHASTRPATLALETEPQPRWIGLSIKRCETQDEDHAVVEFVARYKIGGRAYRLHEISRFVHEQGRWFYISGNIKR